MKKIFLISLFSLGLFSCSKDSPVVGDAFNPTKIVGFQNSTANAAYFSNVGAKPLNLPVVTIGLAGNGELSNSPITISYKVNLAKSTAFLGTEFNFANSTGQITIPAGSTFANIPLIVNTGSLNLTQKTEVVIDLSSTTEGVISNKNKSIKVVFVGCATSLEGNYKLANNTLVTVTKLTPNLYQGSRMPQFQNVFTFNFTDVCKDLEISEWELEGGYAMFKTGSTDRPTGTIATPSGNLIFTGVNITGISFYVNYSFTYFKV